MSTIHLFIVGVILLSLPALVVSVRRVVRERNLLTVILLLLSGSFTATYVSALFHVNHFQSLVSDVSLNLGMYLDLFYISKWLFLSCIGLNVMIFFLVRFSTSENIWRWVTILFAAYLLGCLMLGLMVSRQTGTSLDTCFFALCCGSLSVTGMAWGLSYKEICMIINVYLQAGICLATALWVVWRAVQRLMCKQSLGNILIFVFATVYGLVNIVAFVWVCQHYAMPVEEAFDLCYQELLDLASKYHTSYNNVNYLIFIVLFFILVVGNLFLSKLIKVGNKRK